MRCRKGWSQKLALVGCILFARIWNLPCLSGMLQNQAQVTGCTWDSSLADGLGQKCHFFELPLPIQNIDSKPMAGVWGT